MQSYLLIGCLTLIISRYWWIRQNEIVDRIYEILIFWYIKFYYNFLIEFRARFSFTSESTFYYFDIRSVYNHWILYLYIFLCFLSLGNNSIFSELCLNPGDYNPSKMKIWKILIQILSLITNNLKFWNM